MSVSVIGAGAWGTALAKLLVDKGETVTLWCREPEVIDSAESGLARTAERLSRMSAGRALSRS